VESMRAFPRDASSSPARTREDGFGLAEIMVAMFILAILSIAILPLLVQALQVSARNATIASATQLMQNHVEKVRDVKTCDGVAAVSGVETTIADSRGVSFDITGTIVGDACPADLPGVIEYRVDVARNDAPTETVSTTTTFVLVSTESGP
jgi:prepilin-type N-terminal cleavage/methylation domain-containing protein